MKNHMKCRFTTTDEVLLTDLDRLGEQMNSLSQEELLKLCEEERTVSELEYKISKIDAIQAELWRRSQLKNI